METTEPQILADAPGTADIDVSDLESPAAHVDPHCPHCDGDVTQLVRRVENSTWRQARLTFKAKRDEKAKCTPATADRVEKLERLVTSAIGHLIPGLAAPVQDSTKEK